MDARSDGSWSGIAAAIAAISAVGVAIGLGLPLLSLVLEQRGYSATLIGANTAAAGIASMIAAPAAAPLAGRFGVARLMIAMFVVAGLSFAGFYFLTSFWAWMGLRVSLHGALTLLFVLSEYWINAAAPPGRRGLALGIYATVLALGFALGPLLFAQLGTQGFLPFGVGMGVILIAAIPVITALRHSPEFSEDEEGGNSFLPFLFAVPTATAAVFVFGIVETGGGAFFPIYGVAVGYSPANAALLLTMIGLGSVFLQIPLGFISDRVKDRRHLLMACALVGLAGALLLPLVERSWPLVATLLFVWGGVVAGLYTVGLAHLGSNLSGRELASANSAFVFCYALGMLVGPQAIGIGMDQIGPDGFPLTLGLFFALYALLALLRSVAGKKAHGRSGAPG